MKVLIILGHPNKLSFNHAIAYTCKSELEAKGHIVFFHDLYAENFDPIHQLNNLDADANKEMKTHFSDIKTCDAIVVIHPNWWGQPPAIIKGWMDRILLPGVAYDFTLNEKGEYIPVGLLNAKLALVINTSNTPSINKKDILDVLWEKNVFNICGISQVKRINFGMVRKSDEHQRTKWLQEVKQNIDSLFPRTK